MPEVPMLGPREEKLATVLKTELGRAVQPLLPNCQAWEFVVAATEIALGAMPGVDAVASAGNEAPMPPSLPPAATTSMPRLVAFSMARIRGSHGVPGGLAQISPVSRGPARAGPPRERLATSMPSATASS